MTDTHQVEKEEVEAKAPKPQRIKQVLRRLPISSPPGAVQHTLKDATVIQQTLSKIPAGVLVHETCFVRHGLPYGQWLLDGEAVHLENIKNHLGWIVAHRWGVRRAACTTPQLGHGHSRTDSGSSSSLC